MNKSFRLRFTGYCCLAFLILLASGSCQKKPSTQKEASTATNPAAPQPLDHFIGTWRLSPEKTPVFSPFAYNPIPVYERIVISGGGDRFTLVFSHLSDKPWEIDRVLFTDTKAPGIGIDAVNGKLTMYNTFFHRINADRFTQGSGISENEYKVLPDQKTMTVRQFPLIDNGRERRLVYDKVADSGFQPISRF